MPNDKKPGANSKFTLGGNRSEKKDDSSTTQKNPEEKVQKNPEEKVVSKEDRQSRTLFGREKQDQSSKKRGLPPIQEVSEEEEQGQQPPKPNQPK